MVDGYEEWRHDVPGDDKDAGSVIDVVEFRAGRLRIMQINERSLDLTLSVRRHRLERRDVDIPS